MGTLNKKTTDKMLNEYDIIRLVFYDYCTIVLLWMEWIVSEFFVMMDMKLVRD